MQVCGAYLLIILCVNFEISLSVIAGRADLRGGGADYDVTAVAAFPNFALALLEDFCGLDILEKCAIPLLVMSLDLRYQTEPCCKLRETFLFGGLCEACVHIGPLIVLS